LNAEFRMQNAELKARQRRKRIDYRGQSKEELVDELNSLCFVLGLSGVLLFRR